MPTSNTFRKSVGPESALGRFNPRLEQFIADAGETARIVFGPIPVQIRRFVRLTFMGLVALFIAEALGLEGSSEMIVAAVTVAFQEVLHRLFAPATPDREGA